MRKILVLFMCFMTSLTFAAVDINKATQSEIEAIKGIGPSTSKKILDERKKGPYKNWDDVIDRVSGVGAGNATRFSEAGLTVSGQSYGKSKSAPSAAENRKKDFNKSREDKKANEMTEKKRSSL
jgi:competence protein ComEA